MLYNRKSNKKPKSEIFLVAHGDITTNSANGANPGLNVVDDVNSEMRVEDGQLGFYIDTEHGPAPYGEMSSAVDNDDLEIRIFQGTPFSKDLNSVESINAVSHKELVRSQKIDLRQMIGFSRKDCKHAITNMVSVDGDLLSIVDNADYALNLQFVSVRNDKYFSAHGEEDLTVNYTTPAYGDLPLITQSLSHFIQNVAYRTNLNSAAVNFSNPSRRRGNKQVLALAINKAGGPGFPLGKVEEGVPVTVLLSNGNPVTWTPTRADEEAVLGTIFGSVGIPLATATIEVIDLNTAGTAGDIAAADAILLVALDHKRAIARDDIPQIKSRLRVGVEYISFDGATLNNSAAVAKETSAYEGAGYGWQLKLWYESRAALNIYSAQNRHDGPQEYITPPSYIREDARYNVYILEHKDVYYVPASHDVDWYHRLIILIPCDTVEGDEIKTTFNELLGAWLDYKQKFGQLEYIQGDVSGSWFA